MSEALQPVAVSDDALAFHVIENLAYLSGRILVMVQEGNELSNGTFEVDIVFPESVIGVDEKGLCAIRIREAGRHGALSHKLHLSGMRNDSRFVTHIQQTTYGFTAVRPVVQSTLVHVHAHKLVGQLGIEVARELHGVSKSFIAMIECVLNAFAESCGNASHQFVAEATPDRISS